jgi:dihydroorotase
MNEGALSSRLGLVGRPALAEELMVLRDLELVRLTRSRVHFLHLSTARSLALVVAAKKEGLDVTFEVAPHHFTLDETSCQGFEPLFKVYPPLRGETDVRELRAALARDEVDAVATDHAPHAAQTKDLPFDEAPGGMLGLEHAAALTYEALGSEEADPVKFFVLLSRGPARVAQLRSRDARVGLSAQGSTLEVGDDANLVAFDTTTRWIGDHTALQSRSSNTPYDGRTLLGKVRTTIARGALVVDEGMLT